MNEEENGTIVIGTRVKRSFARKLKVLAAKEDKSLAELMRTEMEKVLNERG